MTNNGNNDFERKIKSSLEGYEVPFVQADWSEMEAKLNTLPKQSPSFNLPNFKWGFSMNVFVAIVVSTAALFLIFKMIGTDKTQSQQAQPVMQKSSPVVNPAADKSQSAQKTQHPRSDGHQTIVSANPSLVDSVQFFPPVNEESVAVKESPAEHTVNPAPAKAGVSAEEKTVKRMDPVQANLNSQDPAKVLFYDDMLDPKKGFIYPTKDKALEASGSSQTNVNLGWNDYVIYDPKRADTTHGKIIPAENKAVENNEVKTKSEKKQKSSKKDKNQEKTENAAAVPDAGTKEVKKDTSGKSVSEPAKSDTTVVKKHKSNKNPKFTNDKSMLDPY